MTAKDLKNALLQEAVMGKQNSEIIVHNENDLKNKIYVIRGVQVMIDSDLAEIYGYETKRFNEQVKNNIERFDEDFRFQLTEEEVKSLRSKFSTTNISSMSRSLPYAFTEQGIYMLMTVLYHIGASLKDLAKKCFAFEILDSSLIPSVINNL